MADDEICLSFMGIFVGFGFLFLAAQIHITKFNPIQFLDRLRVRRKIRWLSNWTFLKHVEIAFERTILKACSRLPMVHIPASPTDDVIFFFDLKTEVIKIPIAFHETSIFYPHLPLKSTIRQGSPWFSRSQRKTAMVWALKPLMILHPWNTFRSLTWHSTW